MGCLVVVEDQLFGKLQQDLAPLFEKNALAVPLAQKAARRKMRDVGGLRQFLIAYIQFDSIGEYMPYSTRQIQ